VTLVGGADLRATRCERPTDSSVRPRQPAVPRAERACERRRDL